MSRLAIHGGSPVITDPLQPFQSIGEDEVIAATSVIRSGVLSAWFCQLLLGNRPKNG
ncbi:MAG: hypothetical protein ABWU13_20495 [Limnospira maxima]